MGNRVAVESYHLEPVARQRQLNDLRGAGVQEVKQDALSLFHPHRLAVTQAFSVDGEPLVSDLPTVGLLVLRLCGLGGHLLAVGFLLHLRGGVERLPLVCRQEDLLVVLSGIVFRFDVHERELSGVSAAVQVGHGHRVSVDEARAEWRGRQTVAQLAVGRHHAALLLFGAIHIGGNRLPVPVHEFRGICVIEQIDGHGNSFAQADERTGHRTVVADGADGMVLGNVYKHWPNPQGDVRGPGRCCGVGGIRGFPRSGAGTATGQEQSRAGCEIGEESAAIVHRIRVGRALTCPP